MRTIRSFLVGASTVVVLFGITAAVFAGLWLANQRFEQKFEANRRVIIVEGQVHRLVFEVETGYAFVTDQNDLHPDDAQVYDFRFLEGRYLEIYRYAARAPWDRERIEEKQLPPHIRYWLPQVRQMRQTERIRFLKVGD